MGKKKLILFATVCIIVLVLSIVIYNYEISQESKNPSISEPSLSVNDFVVYKQVFSWLGLNGSESVTRNIFWNVTSLESNVADIQLLYYSVEMPSNNISFPESQANMKVDVRTGQVINTSNANNQPIGSTFPYWISPSIKQGDRVQTSYGQTVVSQTETLRILNSSHECWLVAYSFQEGNNNYGLYHRYYDINTGLCLRTQIQITLNGLPITVDETAVNTNITPILANS